MKGPPSRAVVPASPPPVGAGAPHETSGVGGYRTGCGPRVGWVQVWGGLLCATSTMPVLWPLAYLRARSAVTCGFAVSLVTVVAVFPIQTIKIKKRRRTPRL